MTDEAIDEIEMIKSALQLWAAERKLIFDDCGEVGFGRACVGIKYGDSYVDLGPQVEWVGAPGHPDEGFWYTEAIPEALPPDGVPDSYHKHPCLAVLVRDGDYEHAIEQLYRWVESIDMAGLIVKHATRHNTNHIEAMMHGLTHTYLDTP